MRIPPRLMPLIEYGIIDQVIRPLLSGKEAEVYLVESRDRLCAAKVYKAATDRTFRNRAQYTEGRTVRNSRDQRAMGKRTRHGRKRDEATWNAAEADTIYKLDAAGVRVPKPYDFVDGVLVMECIEAPGGGPAPRLAEATLEPDYAEVVFDQIIREIVKMLCVDVVHGDLSVFNVLIEEAGAVIIDFPQAIDAAHNNNARGILLRDVANITSHFKRNHPREELRHGHEMWALYERGELRPNTTLTGRFKLPKHEIDAEKLLLEMREVRLEEETSNDMSDYEFTAPPRQKKSPRRPSSQSKAAPKRGGRGKRGTPSPQVVIKGKPVIPKAAPPGATLKKDESPQKQGEAPKKRRRRRRRRRRSGGGGSGSGGGSTSS